MDLPAFRETLGAPEPPPGLPLTLLALWYAGKGDWDQAHDLINDAHGAEEAWVHAHLHRIEGDLSNAGYWYSRAGRPPADAPLDDEWAEIAAALLAR